MSCRKLLLVLGLMLLFGSGFALVDGNVTDIIVAGDIMDCSNSSDCYYYIGLTRIDNEIVIWAQLKNIGGEGYNFSVGMSVGREGEFWCNRDCYSDKVEEEGVTRSQVWGENKSFVCREVQAEGERICDYVILPMEAGADEIIIRKMKFIDPRFEAGENYTAWVTIRNTTSLEVYNDLKIDNVFRIAEENVTISNCVVAPDVVELSGEVIISCDIINEGDSINDFWIGMSAGKSGQFWTQDYTDLLGDYAVIRRMLPKKLYHVTRKLELIDPRFTSGNPYDIWVTVRNNRLQVLGEDEFSDAFKMMYYNASIVRPTAVPDPFFWDKPNANIYDKVLVGADVYNTGDVNTTFLIGMSIGEDGEFWCNKKCYQDKDIYGDYFEDFVAQGYFTNVKRLFAFNDTDFQQGQSLDLWVTVRDTNFNILNETKFSDFFSIGNIGAVVTDVRVDPVNVSIRNGEFEVFMNGVSNGTVTERMVVEFDIGNTTENWWCGFPCYATPELSAKVERRPGETFVSSRKMVIDDPYFKEGGSYDVKVTVKDRYNNVIGEHVEEGAFNVIRYLIGASYGAIYCGDYYTGGGHCYSVEGDVFTYPALETYDNWSAGSFVGRDADYNVINRVIGFYSQEDIEDLCIGFYVFDKLHVADYDSFRAYLDGDPDKRFSWFGNELIVGGWTPRMCVYGVLAGYHEIVFGDFAWGYPIDVADKYVEIGFEDSAVVNYSHFRYNITNVTEFWNPDGEDRSMIAPYCNVSGNIFSAMANIEWCLDVDLDVYSDYITLLKAYKKLGCKNVTTGVDYDCEFDMYGYVYDGVEHPKISCWEERVGNWSVCDFTGVYGYDSVYEEFEVCRSAAEIPVGLYHKIDTGACTNVTGRVVYDLDNNCDGVLDTFGVEMEVEECWTLGIGANSTDTNLDYLRDLLVEVNMSESYEVCWGGHTGTSGGYCSTSLTLHSLYELPLNVCIDIKLGKKGEFWCPDCVTFEGNVTLDAFENYTMGDITFVFADSRFEPDEYYDLKLLLVDCETGQIYGSYVFENFTYLTATDVDISGFSTVPAYPLISDVISAGADVTNIGNTSDWFLVGLSIGKEGEVSKWCNRDCYADDVTGLYPDFLTAILEAKEGVKRNDYYPLFIEAGKVEEFSRKFSFMKDGEKRALFEEGEVYDVWITVRDTNFNILSEKKYYDSVNVSLLDVEFIGITVLPGNVTKGGEIAVYVDLHNTGSVDYDFTLGMSIGINETRRWCNRECYSDGLGDYVTVSMLKDSYETGTRRLRLNHPMFVENESYDLWVAVRRNTDLEIIIQNKTFDAFTITPPLTTAEISGQGIREILGMFTGAFTIVFPTQGGQYFGSLLLVLGVIMYIGYNIDWRVGIIGGIVAVIALAVVKMLPLWVSISIVVITAFIFVKLVTGFIQGD